MIIVDTTVSIEGYVNLWREAEKWISKGWQRSRGL